MKLKTFIEAKQVEYELFVDLDGVMADLTSYVEQLLGIQIVTQSDGNWANDDEIWDQIRSIPGEPDFSKLKLLPDAMQLWNYIKPHRPHILTATGTPEQENAMKKRTFVQRHLTGHGNVHTVKASRMKAQFAHPTAILIDDRTKSTRPWKQAGGIAILHKNAAKTIEKLKELGI
jgi:hypothetical protein